MSLAIPIEFKENQIVEYLLVRESLHRFDTKVRLYHPPRYIKNQGEKRGGYFFYLGAVLALVIYSLFLFFSTREKNYLYYATFCTCILLDVLAISGFLDYLFAFSGMSLSENLIRFSCLASASAFYFSLSYTQALNCPYWVVKLLKALVYSCFLLFFMSLEPFSYFFGKAYLGYVIDIIIVVGVLSMIYLAFRRFLDGIISAKFYLLSWIFMFVGVFAYMGHYAGLFPRNILTSHGLMWGNLIEMLIVSFGLAYKINVLDREKKDALLKARTKEGYERMARVLLHDIRNPMTLMLHYSNMKINNPAKFKKNEEKAWEKIQFSLSKMNEVLDYYQNHEMNIGKEVREITLSEVNLLDAFNDVYTIFEERLSEKRIRLELAIESSDLILAEPVTLVNEVLSNLISNAIKFSPVGGVINVQGEKGSDNLTVIIRDEGGGLTREQVEIFHREGRLSSTLGTRGEEGLGMGLQLVQSYMKLYGGHFDILSEDIKENEKPFGAQFYLTFQTITPQQQS